MVNIKKAKRKIGSSQRKRANIGQKWRGKMKGKVSNHVIDLTEQDAFLDDEPSGSPTENTTEREIPIPARWACETLDEILAFKATEDEAYRGGVLKLVNTKRLSLENQRVLRVLLEERWGSSDFSIINSVIAEIIIRHFYDYFSDLLERNPDIQVGLVTFIDGRFETSHYDTVIDLRGLEDLTKPTLRRMAPNFFAVQELSLFNNLKHPGGGRLISQHQHSLIWGKNILSIARVVAIKDRSRFRPNVTGAEPIDVRKVEANAVNLARMAAYMLKAPYQFQSWYPGKEGKRGNTHHSAKGNRPLRSLRLALIRLLMKADEISFAGGDGNDVRKDIFAYLKARMKKEASIGERIIHPDAMMRFVSDVTGEMGNIRFKLPVIKVSK